MKKVLGYLTVGFALLFSGNAMAADSANVTVSATVLSSCAFINAGDLAFGSINPGLPGPYLPVVTEIDVQCTNLQAFTITDDGGTNGPPGGPFAMDDGLGNNLAYTIAFDAGGVGIGFGGPAFDVPLNLGGSVTQAAAQAVPPGVYNDTVVLSVLP